MVRRLLMAAWLASAAQAQTPAGLFEQVDGILGKLSQITGWKVQRRVPAEMLSRQTFRGDMESHLKKSGSPKELRAEETALKMLGLAPADFDLASETVDLVSEQAAAFYDYNKKKLFILDSTQPGPDQEMALVHELAHALADQQHPLGKFIRAGSPDDDAASARQAVIEGQASWLTWAYMSVARGGGPEVPAGFLDRIANIGEQSNPDYPVLSSAPLYIRESLVFPYNEGMRFEDAVYRKLGRKAFDEVFTRPPRSTQQILHPEEYEKGTIPEEAPPASLQSVVGKDARHWRLLTDGALGEFDFSALLRQYSGPSREEQQAAIELAAHWRGGSFRIYEAKHGQVPILALASKWDSPAAARSFFEMYRGVLKGKWKKMEVSRSTSDELSGQGDSGRFQVRLDGNGVQSVEGLR